MVVFNQIHPNDHQWSQVEGSDGANVFHTREWMGFLIKTQEIVPVVAEIKRQDELVGYLIGGITHKFGMKIFGSPFRGWSSDFMGFALNECIAYNEVLDALPGFVFNQLGCDYLEVIDPRIPPSDLANSRYHVDLMVRYVLDLTRSDAEIFNSMEKDRRKNIRKAARNGVFIEEARDEAFAGDYYRQLQEVFARQSLEAPYSLERIQNMVAFLNGSDHLLLLRARNAAGDCIATYIDLAFNKVVVGWGAASSREFQILRPNEACFWYGINYWKARGMTEYHIGGGWDRYKQSFGCRAIQVPRLRKARNPLIDLLTQGLFAMKNSKLRNWMVRHL